MLAVDIHIDASGSVYKKALFIVARFGKAHFYLPGDSGSVIYMVGEGNHLSPVEKWSGA